MKFLKNNSLLFLNLFLVLTSCGISKTELKQYAATEIYPEDTFLNTVKIKRALVITAHDDDDVAMSGTISKLSSEGWEIKQLCFANENPVRDSTAKKAAKIISDGLDFITIPINQRRKIMDSTTIHHMPVPREKFEEYYDLPLIHKKYMDKINEFNPSIIFSLDNEFGAYGNPEHVIVSQFLVDSFASGAIKVQRIYQAVYPNSMENKIMYERHTKLTKKWGFKTTPYLEGLKIYTENGMPNPEVQINIQSQAENKMKFLRSFEERERKTIGFFVPYFQDFKPKDYFDVFKCEYFRIIGD